MCFPKVFLGIIKKFSHEDRGTGLIDYAVSDGEIFVSNLSYNKNVGVRILDNGIWRDIPFNYSYSLMTSGGDKIEAWRLTNAAWLNTKTPIGQSLFVFRFAVYYNNLDWGTWFWDNNYYSDYYL